MALPQQKMAIRLREIANVLDREVEVRPNILDDVQEFITKFPMAEVPTCLEDNISRLPPEVLEHILHFLPPQDLKAAVQVSKGWKGAQVVEMGKSDCNPWPCQMIRSCEMSR